MKAQIFMTAIVALTLSLNIYLWSIYNNPFYGLLRVTPEAFKMDLEHFQFYLDNPDEQRWHKYSEDEEVDQESSTSDQVEGEEEAAAEDGGASLPASEDTEIGDDDTKLQGEPVVK